VNKYRLASEHLNRFEFFALKLIRRFREYLAKLEDKLAAKYDADFFTWADWDKKDFELID
jgi:hypothetical protein